MARFCGNCGAEVEDDARVCGNCGTPLEDAAPNTGAGPSVSVGGKKLDLKKIIIIAAAAVAVIVVLVIVGNVAKNNSGYRVPLNKYFKSIERGDFLGCMDAYSSLVTDQIEDYHDDIEEYGDQVMDMILDSIEDEVGANPKISYEVKSAKKYSDRKLENLREQMESLDDGFDGDDVKAAYVVDLKVEVKGADDSMHNNVNDVIVVKENGSWKIYQMAGELGL